MNVSFLVPNVGGSSLGFATAFARALATRHCVQILGPDIWGGGVMPIYRGCFDYQAIAAPRLYRFPEYWWQARRLGRAARGDVLFAVKAMPQTVGVALREKRRRGCPVVVCLDEWDGALMARRSPAERRAFWRRHWMHPLEENYYPRVERTFSQADLVLSTSTFLQRKFGGMVVRMGADTDRFQPVSPADKAAVRAQLGLDAGHRVIVFGGVVRPHKGVELILQAMARANEPALRLLVVGPVTDTLRELLNGPHGGQIVAAGNRPLDEMPRWLGAGDFTVLPLADDLLAQSQVPCKVFEAMAMGLPVLASQVSDLPEIVAGAGATFPAGDVDALAGLLRQWIREPSVLAAYAREARRRAVESYSASVMRSQLLAAVARLTERSGG